MCKQKLISNKLDLNQTTRVLHTCINSYKYDGKCSQSCKEFYTFNLGLAYVNLYVYNCNEQTYTCSYKSDGRWDQSCKESCTRNLKFSLVLFC